MGQKTEKKTLIIGGMTCINCQNKIEKKLHNTEGIKSVRVSYSKGAADIVYDISSISLNEINAIIKKLGYGVLTGREKIQPRLSRVIGISLVIVSIYVILEHFGILNMLVPSKLADTRMGYGMLFIIGLITSVHCIAMCGGIALSQCIPHSGVQTGEKQGRFSAFIPALLYNLGRVISYTAVGFLLGFVGLLFGGGADAGLPIMVQGILKLIAGLFMVIMGLNMLSIFPWLRKLQPKMPKILVGKLSLNGDKNRGPLFVGLLNGLMPCGPLQSMQIVALASGNPFAGALSMFLFSLGTVPLMLGLGSVVSVLGAKFTEKVMNVGAILVVTLGLAMLSQGGSLSGLLPADLLLPVIIALFALGIVVSIPFPKKYQNALSTVAILCLAVVVLYTWHSGDIGNNNGNAPESENESIVSDTADSSSQNVGDTQVIESTLSSRSYPDITVQAGTPVKWIIDASEGSLNGCNSRIYIQEYDILNYSLETGENIIEFTPTETGTFIYSCWMGMIRGSITVVEAD